MPASSCCCFQPFCTSCLPNTAESNLFVCDNPWTSHSTFQCPSLVTSHSHLLSQVCCSQQHLVMLQEAQATASASPTWRRRRQVQSCSHLQPTMDRKMPRSKRLPAAAGQQQHTQSCLHLAAHPLLTSIRFELCLISAYTHM